MKKTTKKVDSAAVRKKLLQVIQNHASNRAGHKFMSNMTQAFRSYQTLMEYHPKSEEAKSARALFLKLGYSLASIGIRATGSPRDEEGLMSAGYLEKYLKTCIMAQNLCDDDASDTRAFLQRAKENAVYAAYISAMKYHYGRNFRETWKQLPDWINELSTISQIYDIPAKTAFEGKKHAERYISAICGDKHAQATFLPWPMNWLAHVTLFLFATPNKLLTRWLNSAEEK